MIEVEGLTKYYGSLAAIVDVSFRVERGEIVGFLGPNGAGKSTTIKILTCYMPPSSGTARINGFDCLEDSINVRRQIGYLPENVPLYKEMTVKRFLEFVASAKQIDRSRVKGEIGRVMEICAIEDVSGRIIGNLSKGYRQRVGLAQALLGNPPVIILDEPTIGLDPTQIIEIRNLIKSLGKDHTILMSSHILPEVAQTCNRVVIINKGKVVATDSPENLTRQLQKKAQITVGFEKSINISDLKGILGGLPGIIDIMPADGDGMRWYIETDQERDLRADVAKALVEGGMRLVELKTVDMTLEEVFMHLVTEEDYSAPSEVV
ncbi:MAG: ABC transporter ATP-binding protein [Syntrophobacterales bacterium]|nr:ABC transporter ATP-binding protein [Syntrophobacterales bacterium]